MIPQVASRHISQPRPYDPPPFDPLSFRRRYDQFAPLPIQIPRSPNEPSPHQASEHMLRRKTPSGTLAAGYDGSPAQWSSKPPALKHMLLPVSENCPNNLNFSTHAQLVQYRAERPLNNVQPGNWMPLSSDARPSMDYAPAQPSGAYYSYGNNIPTVLQPPFQPCLGPTASNDGGLYGPYWPNGNFIPYRPAAFRYHGHQATDQNHNLNHGGVSSHPVFGNDPVRLASNASFSLLGANALVQDNGLLLPSPSSFTHLNSSAMPSYPEAYSAPGNQTPRGGSSSHFKEKTLAWAHTIYVDLLTFLHRSKKDRSHNRNGSKSSSKTTIYPKPPRQPASIFRLPQSMGTQLYLGRPDIDPWGQVSGNNCHTWEDKRELNEVKRTRLSGQDAPHYFPTVPMPPPPDLTPSSRAKEALGVLTSLCEESGWCWIDGMLLGGCLAYGLDEHHEALQWYSKIILLDPKHVEAISNLAATLLCLNRREEAEHYWLQSVKLRPSYFEAVEHLIGLLCGDHRGHEAVDIIDFVERSLRVSKQDDMQDHLSETSSNAERDSFDFVGSFSDRMSVDYDGDGEVSFLSPKSQGYEDRPPQPEFGSSGYSIPAAENGRILALIHAKGNMLYALGDVRGASQAFEEAVLISAGKGLGGIKGLIRRITSILSLDSSAALRTDFTAPILTTPTSLPLLLPPEKALQTARLVFAKNGDLPGLRHVPDGLARRAAISTTSNSLLSLAKIFQDSMSKSTTHASPGRPTGVGDILALYYLSLSLQPSPSTANNVGILLASVHQPSSYRPTQPKESSLLPDIPGVIPGSGVALALAYYNYGLNLDSRHAHLYTNLGSLLKDIGQLGAAIKMYEQAVSCDGSFDIALANLANAVKDQGHTSDAIEYYKRAVASSPDFAEAVCGLANALNSVCDWTARGGVILDGGRRDRWHVDDQRMLVEAGMYGNGGGWMKRVVDIVRKQLKEGAAWGKGTLSGQAFHQMLQQLESADAGDQWSSAKRANVQAALLAWAGKDWEGARLVRLIERVIKRGTHRWYVDKHIKKRLLPSSSYPRPQLPGGLSVPSAPTVLPFHTFTCPLSAKEIRMISQRNALRISCSTLKSSWMQGAVFPPPSPPKPQLNIGYVSSDFNNHPLAHLMQSVFGFHDPSRAKAFCYATTISDGSIHRHQIEREAPVFRDVSLWSAERLVQQIIADDIHILVNLNGYTRGARNEVFAARPAPIQMSFMGFAGTLGAEWCDYLLADETAIPPDTLRPGRRNLYLEDQLNTEQSCSEEDWVYSENIIFCRDTFFCCDHAQSEPQQNRLSWDEEQSRRWEMRKELFPSLSKDAIILGNFNQLYKIEPTTFRTWLRILDKVPKAILWLLRFPDLGESNLKSTALKWAGKSVADRIWFTDVAPKHQHISRARVCDLFLDTPECNAHTTAADILWSSTPLLTLPRYQYKMCSRMAASILKGALPKSEEGRRAAADLISKDDEQYEEFAIKLASGLSYRTGAKGYGEGVGRLNELRKTLYDSRWTCALFDTRRWVRDLEAAYEEAWRRWVADEGGDIYL